MQVVPFENLIEEARRLSHRGQSWHFHMLNEECRFNTSQGHFAILLEEEQTGSTLYSLFLQKPLSQAKQLADLCYGEGFLERTTEVEPCGDFARILERVTNYTRDQIPWHHHHFPPQCLLSEHPERHSIVLEDPVTDELLVAVYEQKPVSDLARIERLFFRDLPPAI